MIEIIIAIGVGVVIGIYIVSQVKDHIDSNINQKELVKNMENYDKNKK